MKGDMVSSPAAAFPAYVQLFSQAGNVRAGKENGRTGRLTGDRRATNGGRKTCSNFTQKLQILSSIPMSYQRSIVPRVGHGEG
jgi:hypothetical protein